MRTPDAGSLPMTAFKASKRRRTSPNDTTNSPSTPITNPKLITPANYKKLNITNPICVTCHRSLNATHHLLLCARCSSPTCFICSRTCNVSVSSMPPTPQLTRSSTSSPTIPSPQRMALALQSSNVVNSNTNTNSSGISRKRRKFVEDDDVMEVKVKEGQGERDEGEEDDRNDMIPGCERIICRNCCYENSQNNSITCFDCYRR